MKSAHELEDEEQLRAVRNIVLGQDREYVLDAIEGHARSIVGSVVIEALHDRQKQDDGLAAVFVPLVEKSVEKSVSRHGEQFVGYVYPIVGKLVRKSVAAFLAEFLEKTNQLLENSLSFKGTAWRFKAWKAGVPFSQYVATHTFAYQVEQVFLIHAETGILLNSASKKGASNADADMVSGMLTAINDFVGDSFTHAGTDDEQQLESVKTDDFTLLVQRGPSLMLVAAVSGTIPTKIAHQLQITLEGIHRLFARDIDAFNGDTTPFESTTPELQECLVEQLREPKPPRRPWLAIALFTFILLAILVWGIKAFEQQQLLQRIRTLDHQPGIVVRSVAATGFDSIRLSVLRDPHSIDVATWLEEQAINPDTVQIDEKPYLSLEQPLVYRRIGQLVSRYPDVRVVQTGAGFYLEGNLPNRQRQRLLSELSGIPGLTDITTLTERLNVAQSPLLSNQQALKAMLNLHTATIDASQIQFESGQSELTDQAKEKLAALSQELDSVITIAKQLQLSVGLMIMGASDASGSAAFNQRLSLARAQAVLAYLVSLGADPGYLNAVGLGVVQLQAVDSVGARKVMFNLVDFTSD